MSINKISSVDFSSISKVSGVAKANVSKVLGVSAPVSFSNTKSLSTDGVNDFFEISLGSDIIPHTAGSISYWVKVASDEQGSVRFFSIFDASQTTSGRIDMFFFGQSGTTVKGLIATYRDETSDGTFAGRFCATRTGSSHLGKAWSRVTSDHGDFGSASDSMYNAANMRGVWKHVVLTWDTSASYTNPSTSVSYSGAMKIYVDGTLRGEGQSNFPSHNTTGTSHNLVGIDSGTVFDTIRIGANFNDSQHMDALIDEWALFDKVLSASEVSNIYNSGVPADLSGESDLIGWWRFEDDTSDSSSNSNSGTLTNGATFSSTTPS